MELKIGWYGPPQVLFEGQRVIFPFRKAEALLYYLAVEKRASRDRLLALLWPDMDESGARRNLRNALYVIRKMTCEDVLQTPNRDWVEWNTEFPVHTEASAPYTGEFLEGFSLKDADPFEEWLGHQRDKHREEEQQLLWQKARSAQKSGRNDECRASLTRLLQLDEYDENAYRMLMQCWADNGNVHRAIEVYQDLSGLLRRELGITPEDTTTRLYETLIKEKSHPTPEVPVEPEKYFHGRNQELQQLRMALRHFQAGEPTRAVLIHGEAGIGKTELLRRFLSLVPESVTVLSASCYATEENAWYRPWEAIERQMINRDSAAAPGSTASEAESETAGGGLQERLLLERLERQAEEKPVILIFEDVHWADPMSLHRMTRLLMKNRNRSVWIIATSRTGNWNELGSLVVEGRREELLECVELVRFTPGETLEFARGYLSEKDGLCPEEELFHETEGNPFFLVEYLNHWRDHRSPGRMTPRMQDVLLSRLARVGTEAQKVLDLVSVFRDRVPLGVLRTISGLDEMELIDQLDELYKADLLRESQASDGDLELFFTHQKLRDFVFDRLSEAKRRILFRRIADTYAAQFQASGRMRWDLLDYYYNKAGEQHQALNCGLQNLNGFLEAAYETFPVLPGRGGQEDYSAYNEEEVGLELKRLEERLLKLEDRDGRDACHDLRMQWLLMTARYHIKIGQYTQGLKALEELKGLAAGYRMVPWQIKAGFQEIYYCINAHRTAQMEWVADETLDLAQRENMPLETAILLRLKGFHRILIGDFTGGEAYLVQSLRQFQDFGQPVRYALNIAAVYYYLGESHRYRNQWTAARSYYEEAIRLCLDIGQEGRLTIFFTQAGHGAYENDALDEAEMYLERALSLYSNYDFRWGHSTACGFMGLIRLKQQRHDEAKKFLEDALHHARRLGNPYEMGLVNRVMAEADWMAREAGASDDALKAICQMAANAAEYTAEPLPDRCYEIDVLEPISHFYEKRVSLQ